MRAGFTAVCTLALLAVGLGEMGAEYEPCTNASAIYLNQSQACQLEIPEDACVAPAATRSCDWTVSVAPGNRIKLSVEGRGAGDDASLLVVTSGDATNVFDVGLVTKVVSSGPAMILTVRGQRSFPTMLRVGRVIRLGLQRVLEDSLEATLVAYCDGTNEFRCADRYACIDARGRCDVFPTCPDRSDEDGCLSCPSSCICTNDNTTYAWLNTTMLMADCSSHRNVTAALDSLTVRTSLIKLQKNRLRNLTATNWARFSYLFVLDLQENNLTRLPLGVFDGLRNLYRLKLNLNNLTIIEPGVFRDLASLIALRLSNNMIANLEEESFAGLSNLQVMRIGHNQVTRLRANTFRHLTNLFILEMSFNKISFIEKGAFAGLSKLTSVDIRGNPLKVIQADIFLPLVSLLNLDFGNSEWTRIEPGAFRTLGSLSNLILQRRDEYAGTDFAVDKHELEHLSNLTVLIVDDRRMCCLLGDAVNERCWVDGEGIIKYIQCKRIIHNIVLRSFNWFLGISAFLGNVFIIVWRMRNIDSGKRSQSVLILNLAGSDLIMGCYMLFLGGADAYYGDGFFMHSEVWTSSGMCKFIGFLSMLSSEASMFFICLISVDRFLCVVFPFGKSWLRLDTARTASAVVWAAALVISLLPLCLERLVKNPNFYGQFGVCVGLPIMTHGINESNYIPLLTNKYEFETGQEAGPSWIYSKIVYLGINLLCCLVVVVCYISIAFVVTVKLPSKKLKQRKDKEHRKREMTMAFRMLLIVSTDMACWMPVIVMGIFSQTGILKISKEVYAWIVVLVIPINSAINPYLYTVSNSNIVTVKCCMVKSPRNAVDTVRMTPLPSHDKDHSPS